MYVGTCSCGEVYIGETVRISDFRWKEDTCPAPSATLTDPGKHVLENPGNSFSWKVLTRAPTLKGSVSSTPNALRFKLACTPTKVKKTDFGGLFHSKEKAKNKHSDKSEISNITI